MHQMEKIFDNLGFALLQSPVCSMGSFINYATQLGGRGLVFVLHYGKDGEWNGHFGVTEGGGQILAKMALRNIWTASIQSIPLLRYLFWLWKNDSDFCMIYSI